VALGVHVLAGIENLHDVRMLELRGRERLAPEAGDEGLVLGEVLREQLHRHAPLEHRVHREEDGRHTACAEPALESVAVSYVGGSCHQSSSSFFSCPGGIPPGPN
jgi:hypothetical protein